MKAGSGCWRVQATWMVGYEPRSHQPVLVRTRAEAEELAADMAATLAHFPTLRVLIDYDPDGVPTNFEERPSRVVSAERLGEWQADDPV